jgi:parallel beta-helix repeat protein
MYGIRLENSAGCVAIGNLVSVRVGGIHLENATNCTVEGNYLTQNDQGIRLYSPCMNNIITANTVENNSYDGIITPMPENTTFANNSFFHNNFVNNSNPFIVQSSGTIWDNGFEGNYWSRYTGIDADQNGIGDAPINIGQDQDHYPLMGRFSEFSFQSKRKTYTVPLVCNTSIIDFKFESANNGSTIGFGVSCETETAGFCRIAIPSELMSPPFTLLVDNSTSLNYTLRILPEVSYNAYKLLHFTYPEGSHRIAIVADSSLPSISTAFIPVLSAIPAVAIGPGTIRSEGFANMSQAKQDSIMH